MHLFEAFADVADPRAASMVDHRLLDLIAIALCAVLCGADSWVEVECFGQAKEAWLCTWLPLPHGIASHDTFGRVFAQLDPAELARGFGRWVAALQARLPVPDPQTLALRSVDGQQSRRSHDRWRDQPALHQVSVWASEARLILANQAVAEKSNEITAIPLLLAQLDISGCVVTTDAMGCQRAIAQQIVDQHADYVLALKDNQATLAQDVRTCFAELPRDPCLAHTQHETRNKDHGRLEWRHMTVITDPQTLAWIQAEHAWPGLQAIGRVVATRNSVPEPEPRYYLLSAPFPADRFGEVVRGHWGIENRVHWILDLAFANDTSRVRVGHGAENFSLLRRLALNVLQQDHAQHGGVKARRLRAGWDTAYLLHLLALVSERAP